jgi:hypothetical protein
MTSFARITVVAVGAMAELRAVKTPSGTVDNHVR